MPPLRRRPPWQQARRLYTRVLTVLLLRGPPKHLRARAPTIRGLER